MLIIRDISKQRLDNRIRLSARITLKSEAASRQVPHELWIEWPADYGEFIEEAPDPFVVLMVPLAGVLNEPIQSAAPVSERLFNNLIEAQGVYRSFYPDIFTATALEMDVVVRRRSLAGMQGSFFSGGVDSAYNIAETRRRSAVHGTRAIDSLWLCQGMDIVLSDTALWDEVKSRLSVVSREYVESPLATCASNLRAFYDPFLGWEDLGFGPALAGIAKSVAPAFDRVLIASASAYGRLIRRASHPMVDSLFSCDRQNIVHYSSCATRLQKVEVIGTHAPGLLRSLRVCWRNPDNAYNCGRCEKCIRTHLQLEALGLGHLCQSLALKPEPAQIRAIRFPCTEQETYIRESWKELARRIAGSQDFQSYDPVIRSMLRRNWVKCRWKALAKMLRGVGRRKRKPRPYNARH